MTTNAFDTLGYDPNGTPYVTRIFTYGTLMRGYQNHKRFLTNAEFLGEAETLAQFAIYDGAFPVAVRAEREAVRIRGEVFAVTQEDLADCDCLEGHPHMYRRESVLVRFSDRAAPSFYAWMYVYQHVRSLEHVRPLRAVDGVVKWSRTYD